MFLFRVAALLVCNLNRCSCYFLQEFVKSDFHLLTRAGLKSGSECPMQRELTREEEERVQPQVPKSPARTAASASTCPIRNKIQRVGCRLFSKSSRSSRHERKDAPKPEPQESPSQRHIRNINLPGLIAKREVSFGDGFESSS